MNLFKYLLLSLPLLFSINSGLLAQELNCTVDVNSEKVQTTDRRVYETLKNSVTEFMNTRKWTNDQYLNQEKIDCSILITISEHPNTDQFRASFQISARRPIYHSSYFSTTISFNDNDFFFKYIEYQQLDYNDNTFNGNLTAVLAYYAYMVLGLDYDTFAENGGTPFYQRAQQVVNNAQSANEDDAGKGWKAFEGTRNRYWLVENMLNPVFVPIRTVYYKYHRQGLDLMADNKDVGRAVIADCLEPLKAVTAQRPGSIAMQIFTLAKGTELVKMFKEGGSPEEKTKVVDILSTIDPANSSKYQAILQN